jgi:hypothetical protein
MLIEGRHVFLLWMPANGRGHGFGVALAVCDVNDRHGLPSAAHERGRWLAIR